MSTVVNRRTRARGAQLFRGSSRHRREAIASAAKAFWRSETHRGLPTGTIALRRRRVGLTTLAAVVDESAFGFAGDVAVAFRVRGSMFSLFSSSQLAYARRLGTVLVLRLPKPRARALGSGLAQLRASGAPSGFSASSDGMGWRAVRGDTLTPGERF